MEWPEPDIEDEYEDVRFPYVTLTPEQVEGLVIAYRILSEEFEDWESWDDAERSDIAGATAYCATRKIISECQKELGQYE